MPQLYSLNNMQKTKRPRQDSNLQSSDPKSGALSIRPRGHHCATTEIKFSNHDNER